jgi:hypothetical protein
MKTRVQAQHLQIGDIVGSGEKVNSVTINSINWPNNIVRVALEHKGYGVRSVLWGKYTMIGVERMEKKAS